MAAGIWFSACFVGLVGLSFHGSINGALERNVTATVGGHLQVYSGTTRNELEIFGKDDGTMANVGVIENANAIADRLRKVDNIERVVPLGSGTAMLVTGNLLDRELEKLRDSVREQDEQRTHVAFKRVRGVIEWLREEDSEISTSPALQRTADEEFWRGFASSPWPVLEFLESDVAPLLGNAKVVVLSLLGAEPEVFSKSFDRWGDILRRLEKSLCERPSISRMFFRSSPKVAGPKSFSKSFVPYLVLVLMFIHLNYFDNYYINVISNFINSTICLIQTDRALTGPISMKWFIVKSLNLSGFK